MALTLDDIKQNKLKRREKSLEFESAEKRLRPWDDIDQKGAQTRTFNAKEAVKKAREIVERNNLRTLDRLNKFGPSSTNLDFLEKSEEKLFDPIKFEEDLIPSLKKTKSQFGLKSILNWVD
jgi:hypothetical protein